MRDLGIIEEGAFLIDDGVITNIGPGRRVENLAAARRAEEIDAAGRVVMPGFVDSHTHLIYGPPRLADYEMRLQGRSYAEIAAAGGGIQASVRAVRGATSKRLLVQARAAVRTMARHGTTSVEVKSGYGLDEASELKMLRVAAALNHDPLDVVPTFLGAHATPPEFQGRSDEYIDWLRSELIPLVAQRKLARFADVYCDADAFSAAQARRYLQTARQHGLEARVHAGQFSNLGAVSLAVELGARSADHLEQSSAADVQLLARSAVMATLLPGSVFHLGLSRFAPARELIDAGAAVALATDFNPGTSPTCSMQMVVSLACAEMKMTPAEAISAATINGAHALGLASRTGTLEAGKQADFLILSASDYREIPYYFGINHVASTIKRGKLIYSEKDCRDL